MDTSYFTLHYFIGIFYFQAWYVLDFVSSYERFVRVLKMANCTKLSAIVYMVMSRQLFGKTIKEVRTDLERTEDQDQTAYTLTEYIEKQGGGSWVEKLQEDLGPWLMIQLCDVADLFEILRKYDRPYRPS